MKATFSALALTVLFVLAAGPAQAAPTQLQCRSVEGSTLFESLTLTMQLPDDQGGTIAPGEWMSQSVTLAYGAPQERMTLKTRLRHLEGINILKGNFQVGQDFGSADMVLFHDYDNSEVVAVIQVSTDGPITVETHRCK